MKRHIATEEVLRDKILMAQIKEGLEYFRKGGKGYTFEKVFGKRKLSRKKNQKVN